MNFTVRTTYTKETIAALVACHWWPSPSTGT